MVQESLADHEALPSAYLATRECALEKTPLGWLEDEEIEIFSGWFTISPGPYQLAHPVSV